MEQIENGLNTLRAEARGTRGKNRSWKRHNELMRYAQLHVEKCGGSWEEYEPRLKREFAELMRL